MKIHNDIAECEICGKYYHDYDLDMLKVTGKIVDMSDIRPYNLMQG